MSRLPVAALLACALAAAALPLPAAAAHAEALTLERVFASPALTGPRPRVLQLSPDGRLATLLKSRADDKDRFDLWAVDTQTGQSRMLVDSARLASSGPLSEAERMNRERQRIADVKGITQYGWAPDGRRLLVPVDGDLWVAGVDGSVQRLTETPATETDARLSPRGGYASFVRDGRLFVQALAAGSGARDIAGEATPKVAWGVAEFIAQEELSRFEGHWWAPDDARIAVARVDERPVREVTRAAIGADGTRLFTQAYPAAGTANAEVTLWLMNPDGSGRVAIDLGPPADHYIARVAWAQDGRTLYVQRLNREQTRLDIMAVDAATGAARVLHSETSTTWINLHDSFEPLQDGSILWASEADGHRHLYRLAGGTARQLTRGRWVVDELVGVKEKDGRLWFTGFADSTLEKHVYSLDWKRPGATPQRLTTPGGWHEAVMDKAGRRLIITGSTPTQPAQVWLADGNGKRLTWIEENRLAPGTAHPYAPYLASHVVPEFGTLKAADGQAMDWRLLKPAGPGPFPVLMQVYGGPHAHNVQRRFPAVIEQFLVQQGWAVFQIDNRGSNNRGKAFEDPIHRAMGGVEVADQLQALAWIKQQPWARADKIAVNGWSYGGYMVLKLLEAAPGQFAAGISGAPVTRWELYDTAYTERYLGNPARDAGPYNRSGALADAGKISDPLLLIHGMADDNVVFENSTALMTALQRARRPFDLMVYPGATHATPGLEVHTWITRLRFLGRTVAPTGF